MSRNSITPEIIRRLIIETAAECGEAAQIGGSLSMVELLNVLFGSVLRHRPDDPTWPDRDIFILSKGHAVLGYFATLHAYGYFDRDKLKTFQTNGSDLIAHPVKKYELGIESSNGSLGQGLSFGLGMAIGMQKRSQDRRVYVLLGDGECNEGSVWETAALAGERHIANIVAIIDENGFRNDGENSMYTRGPVIADVWRAFNWNVLKSMVTILQKSKLLLPRLRTVGTARPPLSQKPSRGVESPSWRQTMTGITTGSHRRPSMRFLQNLTGSRI